MCKANPQDVGFQRYGPPTGAPSGCMYTFCNILYFYILDGCETMENCTFCIKQGCLWMPELFNSCRKSLSLVEIRPEVIILSIHHCPKDNDTTPSTTTTTTTTTTTAATTTTTARGIHSGINEGMHIIGYKLTLIIAGIITGIVGIIYAMCKGWCLKITCRSNGSIAYNSISMTNMLELGEVRPCVVPVTVVPLE